MMTIYIVSIGFNITNVLAKFKEISLTQEDRIIFVRPETDEDRDKGLLQKVRETEDAIEQAFNQYRYTIVDIDDADAYPSIKKILEATWNDDEKYKGPIVLLLSGGTRSEVSILTLYGQMDPRVSKIFVYSENVSRHIDVPIFNPIKNMSPTWIVKYRDELDNIKKKGTSKNRSAAKKLRDQGLVIKLPGRGGRYQLTNLGDVYLKIYEIALETINKS